MVQAKCRHLIKYLHNFWNTTTMVYFTFWMISIEMTFWVIKRVCVMRLQLLFFNHIYNVYDLVKFHCPRTGAELPLCKLRNNILTFPLFPVWILKLLFLLFLLWVSIKNPPWSLCYFKVSFNSKSVLEIKNILVTFTTLTPCNIF